MYNWLSNKDSGITPWEILTRSKYDYRDLLCFHVSGCPVFFLEPKLQNDKKPQKCNQRAHLGQFIAFLYAHYYLVDSVIHISTVYISPQFHLGFDDLFETVTCQGDNDSTIEAI